MNYVMLTDELNDILAGYAFDVTVPMQVIDLDAWHVADIVTVINILDKALELRSGEGRGLQ